MNQMLRCHCYEEWKYTRAAQTACQGAWVKREFNQQGIGEDEVGEGRKK